MLLLKLPGISNAKNIQIEDEFERRGLERERQATESGHLGLGRNQTSQNRLSEGKTQDNKLDQTSPQQDMSRVAIQRSGSNPISYNLYGVPIQIPNPHPSGEGESITKRVKSDNKGELELGETSVQDNDTGNKNTRNVGESKNEEKLAKALKRADELYQEAKRNKPMRNINMYFQAPDIWRVDEQRKVVIARVGNEETLEERPPVLRFLEKNWFPEDLTAEVPQDNEPKWFRDRERAEREERQEREERERRDAARRN